MMNTKTITILIITIFLSGCSPHFYEPNIKCNELSSDLTLIESEFDTRFITYEKLNSLRSDVSFCKKQIKLSQSDYKKYKYLEERLTELENKYNQISKKGEKILLKPIETLE